MICEICGKNLTTSAGIASHMRKHVKDGSATEARNSEGLLEWTPTGKEPQEKLKSYCSNIRTREVEPRHKTIARANKKGDIEIKCRKCGKWVNAVKKKILKVFADDRFTNIDHCDTITLFPMRMVNSLRTYPGREFVE